MKTHEQATAGPDDATLALQKQLANLCKRSASTFAELVRQADRLMAAGVERNAAYRQALGAVHSPQAPDPWA